MSTVDPTLLSTFELLFAPQLPPNVMLPTVVSQIGENVVKGYFLTLSNPNPAPYTIRVGLHTSADLKTQAVALADGAMPGTTVTIGGSAPNWYVSVAIPAAGTVLLGILPLFFNSMGFPTPNIDLRGYADLTLPALLNRTAFAFVPQASAPVTILATPEQRLTFLPISGSPMTVVEAQAAFALPIVGGSAALQVPPQPGRRIFVPTPTPAPPSIPQPVPQPGPLPSPDPGPLGLIARVRSAGLESTAAQPLTRRVQSLLDEGPAAATEALTALLAFSPAVASGAVRVEEIFDQLGISQESAAD